MSGVSDGARGFRHSRGRFEPDEIPATVTAQQRGRLQHRAKAGVLAAKRALAEWARERNAKILADAQAAQERSADV